MTTTASRTLKKVLWEKQLLCMCITLFGTFLCRKCTTTSDTRARWRHLFILMCQLEAHWFLKQKIPLFYSLQIWMPKTMFINSDVSYCLMWRFVEEVYKILSFVLSNLVNKWKFNTKWDQIHKRRRYPLSPNSSYRASLCDYTWRLTLDLTGLNCFIVLLSFFHTHKI